MTPTPLKTPDFKGFYSSRFAIDSNMTAKNQDALLFTAEHLFLLSNVFFSNYTSDIFFNMFFNVRSN